MSKLRDYKLEIFADCRKANQRAVELHKLAQDAKDRAASTLIEVNLERAHRQIEFESMESKPAANATMTRLLSLTVNQSHTR